MTNSSGAPTTQALEKLIKISSQIGEEKNTNQS
jgi:hypothetical protein